MSAYLARLKQIENGKYSSYVPNTEPSKPSKPPFEPFEGTCPAHIDENLIDDPRNELTRLVRVVADAHGFTEEDHAEALEGALADFNRAMTCFKTLAAEIQTTAGEHAKRTGDTLLPHPR